MPLVCVCECVTVVIIKTALVAATRFTYLIFFATRHDYKQLSRYGCARGPQYLFVGITKKTRHGLDLGPRACTPRVGRGRFSPFPFSVVFPAFPWRARGYATRSDALRFFTRCFPFLVYRNAHFLAAVPAAVQYTTHTHTHSLVPIIAPSADQPGTEHVFVSPNAKVRTDELNATVFPRWKIP